MVIKHIKKFFGFTEQVAVAPYKVDAPAEVVTPAPALDPVAVALDLEPLTLSTPDKKPRKPRAPKAEAVKATKAPAKKPAVKKPVAKKTAVKPKSKKV